MNIRVAIIEDHAGFRDSVLFMLGATEGFTCIGAFGSVEEAMKKMKEPDVLLCDIHLPGMSGTEAVPLIKNKFPDTRIIMVTVFEDDANVFKAIVAGADGYVLKKTAPMRLLQAIEDAASGGSPMSPTIARQALNLFKERVPHAKGESVLSSRESEVLSCLVKGMSNDEIAEQLFISRTTVRNHIRHIYEKLHVHSKSQAVVKAMQDGLV
jgi:DNA-binding NarL/FixJ family response regulator